MRVPRGQSCESGHSRTPVKAPPGPGNKHGHPSRPGWLVVLFLVSLRHLA